MTALPRTPERVHGGVRGDDQPLPRAYEISPELAPWSATPDPDVVQALRHLAGEVTTRHLHQGGRALAVCGVSRGVGVSFTATNLAATLAQLGVETLLVDANLEFPSLHRIIAPDRPQPGLFEVLVDGGRRANDAICPEVLPGLSLVYSGNPDPTQSVDVLGSDALFRFVDVVTRNFQCVIFDTVSANRSAGARLVAAVAGTALIVAGRHQTFADDVSVLMREMRTDGVAVLGAILNR